MSRPSVFVPDKIYCQHDEEAIIIRLFEGLGHKHKLCDIGARLRFSNSARLIFDYGYGGTLVEPHAKAAAELRTRFKGYPVEVRQEKATIKNINDFVGDADFLSIDTDRNDWWLWAAVESKPRVVCVEFNHRMNGRYIAPYNDDMPKCGGDKLSYGATRDAFMLLADLKGYEPIAETGCNLIFAIKDPFGVKLVSKK